MTGDVTELLRTAHGGEAVANLGRQLGLTPEQVEEAAAVLMPELARGFERNMLDRKGLAGVADALSSGRHARYAEDPAMLADPAVKADGERILGHLLGSKTGSRQIAAYAHQETGLSTDVIKQMLPLLASIFMGSLAKQSTARLGGIFDQLPRGGGSAGGGGGGFGGGLDEILRRLPQGGGLEDILRRLPQGGGPGGGWGGDAEPRSDRRGAPGGGFGIPPLPRTSGGGPVDIPGLPGSGGRREDQDGGFSIPGLPEDTDRSPGGWDPRRSAPGGGPDGGGWGPSAPAPRRGGAPLPGPDMGGGSPFPGGGSSPPYGDMGDILRRGGAGAGILATILRTILGSLIGRGGASANPGAASGGGWIGWIIKLLLMRYGWRIVTSIFKGMLRR